jgi:hypothetical protein
MEPPYNVHQFESKEAWDKWLDDKPTIVYVRFILHYFNDSHPFYRTVLNSEFFISDLYWFICKNNLTEFTPDAIITLWLLETGMEYNPK